MSCFIVVIVQMRHVYIFIVPVIEKQLNKCEIVTIFAIIRTVVSIPTRLLDNDHLGVTTIICSNSMSRC